MDIENNPPDGFLSHAVASIEGGGMRFWEVWESEDHIDRFEEERLLPAMREVFGDVPGEARQWQIEELHFFFAP